MYDVGDVLHVLPEQNPAAVDAFIRRCNLNPGSYITVSTLFVANYIAIILSSSFYLSAYLSIYMMKLA